jgi:glycosyltransferase involved in cell wall biosynthesis
MDPARLHIVSAGWLVLEKGHHRIAALLPRLHAAGLPADLWILGDEGRGESAAAELARILSGHDLHAHVHRPGAVGPETLAEYMSACDVFCLASLREGWPNVVHEALACGAPVVATNVGAVSSLIPSDAYGIIVPPRDDEALLAALERALRTPFDRAAIARHGASRSWERVAQEVHDLIETIFADSVSAGAV